MTDTRTICRFATAYAGLIHATSETNRIVWQDMYVKAADELGLRDEDHKGLGDHRAEAKRRHDDAVAFHRTRHPLNGDQ